MGQDKSTNSNNFDGNNLQQKDQAQDTCTNNFATMKKQNNICSFVLNMNFVGKKHV